MSKGLRLITGVAILTAAFFFPVAAPFLVPLGASLALGAVLEPKPLRIDRLQSQNVLVRSAVKPQEIVYGETRKSGVLVWYDTSGDANEYLWFVVAVCEHEIESFEKLWIDETEIDISTEIDGSGMVTHSAFVNADGTQLVKTGFHTGSSTQVADADLVAAFTEWDSTHKGNDIAYFWVRCQLDTSEGGNDPDNPTANVWYQGYPRDLSVTIKGALVYDPRLDSTNGGTGTHRADDSTTWEWSDNSVLCRTDYIRSDRFGPGYSSTDIDWTVVAAQADIADEVVSLPESGTQKRYTLNGVVTVSDTPKTVIEDMQSADHGVTLFLPDGVQVRCGGWDASSHTIDNTWLAGGVSVVSSSAADNAYNAVRGQFMSADDDYALIEFMPRTSSAYETEDGVGRVWQDIVLPFCTDEYRAQRMAIIELKKSRQQMIVSMQCNFRAELVQLYDVVTLNCAEFSGETFRVIGKASATDGTTTLELREEASTDWDYSVPDLATPPIIPDVVRTNNGPQPPTGLTATTVLNGVQLEWTNPNMLAVSHIEVYGSSTNDRTNATILTRTRSEQYTHLLAEGTVRYYWILARGENGLVSTWHPVSSVAGVEGTAGAAGADGDDAIHYYIKPISGTAIKNGSGTLTVEAHLVTGGVDAHLSSGPKLYVGTTEVTEANGYGVGSDGYTGVFDSGDINGAVTVELKDGPSATVLDTITLVDIADGGAAVSGYIEPSAPLSWTRASDQTTWTPAATTVDLDCTFVQDGSTVARVAWRVTRDADGILTGATTTHKDGDFNASRVTVVELDETSQAMSVKFTYSYSGDTCVVTETVITSMAGAKGDKGDTGDSGSIGMSIIQGTVYKRSATAPTAPGLGTGSYNFTTQVLTPPSGWSVGQPAADGNPLYSTTSTFSSATGVGENDNTEFWSTPQLVLTGAVTATLTNGNPTVAADIEGFNYDLDANQKITGTDSVFQVVRDNTDITDTETGMYLQDYTDGWNNLGSGLDYKTVNGLTFIIDRDSGDMYCKISSTPYYNKWTSDSETVAVRATVDSTVYNRQWTVTKSKSGSSGSIYIKIPKIAAYATSGTVAAYVKFDNDGYVYKRTDNGSTGTYTQVNQWLLSGTNSDYSIRASVSSGDESLLSGTYDSFLDMGTDRAFYITSNGGVDIVRLEFEVQRDSSSEVIYQGSVILEAHLDVT